jgi:hypothetical protein
MMVMAGVDEPDISTRLHLLDWERFRAIVPVQLPVIFTMIDLQPVAAVI